MTAEVKHTEGPWERVDTADYAEIHPVGKRLHSAIALVGKPEDADLVAAAPVLLEALTKLTDECVKQGINFGPLIADAQDAMIAARGGHS